MPEIPPARPIRVMALDHHFGQDLAALSLAGAERIQIRRVDPEYFSERAARYLPRRVFHGLLDYHDPGLAEARARWAVEAARTFEELYALSPFDVFVVPSDTFFYIRDVVPVARRLGIPFIVVQKETTIAPHGMEHHAKDIGRLYPFIGDIMTVCSEHHRSFWIRAGADPAKVIVTGQPRFDYYASPSPPPSWADLGAPVEDGPPVILFFSYQLDAYTPASYGAGVGSDSLDWRRLREETEAVLLRFADRANIVVKPHPQQDPRDVDQLSRALAEAAPGSWGRRVHVAPRAADTRALIRKSDIVVGFQTTALFEAAIAGKPVLYTRWSDTLRALEPELVPLHEYGDVFEIAESPKDLEARIADHLASGRRAGAAAAASAKAFNSLLGPVDGNASKRVISILEAAHRAARPSVPEARLQVDRRREKIARRERALARRHQILWRLVRATQPSASRLALAAQAREGRAAARARHAGGDGSDHVPPRPDTDLVARLVRALPWHRKG